MTTDVMDRPSKSDLPVPLRVASVSFLNAKPLIYGLERDPQISLLLDVPAKLIDWMRSERADVALLPVIDYQRMDGLRIVPSGGIGCDGETLTVRIFSKGPIEKIESLSCDVESHTSVALARIILAERFGIRPEFQESVNDSARLLIGDKVVCNEPAGFTHQLDLGAAWKEMTGLPFVFAVWMARDGVELGDLPEKLERARQRGMEHIDQIIQQHGIPRGWPAPIARQYLTRNLQFEIGPRQIEAIQRFHQLAQKHGTLERVQTLRIVQREQSC